MTLFRGGGGGGGVKSTGITGLTMYTLAQHRLCFEKVFHTALSTFLQTKR